MAPVLDCGRTHIARRIRVMHNSHQTGPSAGRHPFSICLSAIGVFEGQDWPQVPPKIRPFRNPVNFLPDPANRPFGLSRNLTKSHILERTLVASKMDQPTVSMGSTSAEFHRLHRQLAAMVGRFAKSEGGHQTSIPALSLFRRSVLGSQFHGVYEPALCLVAQGAKRVMVGDDTFDCDHAHCLITSVDMPVITQVMRASPDEPYLGILFDFDPCRIRDLMAEPCLPKPGSLPVGRGMAVSTLSDAILDAVVRLVCLLDTPEDIPVLGPLIEREILYRLLTGEQGLRLRHIAVADSRMHQVSRAIDWIRQNFARPLCIEVLAQIAHVSVSSLHHNFKAVTGMSPLQYQKRLRLQEARRLMLAEMLDAAPAAHQVGYESPSQFCREYGRLFGAPPGRDIAQLRLDARAAYYVGRTIPRVPMTASS